MVEWLLYLISQRVKHGYGWIPQCMERGHGLMSLCIKHGHGWMTTMYFVERGHGIMSAYKTWPWLNDHSVLYGTWPQFLMSQCIKHGHGWMITVYETWPRFNVTMYKTSLLDRNTLQRWSLLSNRTWNNNNNSNNNNNNNNNNTKNVWHTGKRKEGKQQKPRYGKK